MLEIRWHSRAGQGAVTGAKALCEVMAEDGKYVQAFSVYGAEKRGAPMHAFNRISDEAIVDHSKSMLPDYVLVIDPSLVYTNVSYDTKPDARFIITTHLSKADLIKEVPDLAGKNVSVVDCIRISQETIGRAIPNTPMLGAFIKVSNAFSLESFSNSMSKILKKFPQKVIDGNLQAIKRAYDEVQ
ncbi:MAG: pyruvate flavodoxin oxidoreductase subunit gamma [Helicobacteraceae bacterium]|jgi:pyruvate ferredoxin oxidoreductase gamma subunit|nr:pyruvate flavodoxin oxidoreductase subunit gamma [Helicobacteraceae bacterium]